MKGPSAFVVEEEVEAGFAVFGEYGFLSVVTDGWVSFVQCFESFYNVLATHLSLNLAMTASRRSGIPSNLWDSP